MQHLRWKAIANLNNLIDRKGNLQPNTKLYNLELELLNVVIPALQSNGYPESKYTLDLGRVGIVNFENIRELETVEYENIYYIYLFDILHLISFCTAKLLHPN